MFHDLYKIQYDADSSKELAVDVFSRKIFLIIINLFFMNFLEPHRVIFRQFLTANTVSHEIWLPMAIE